MRKEGRKEKGIVHRSIFPNHRTEFLLYIADAACSLQSACMLLLLFYPIASHSSFFEDSGWELVVVWI